jgi:hypothetical protein
MMKNIMFTENGGKAGEWAFGDSPPGIISALQNFTVDTTSNHLTSCTGHTNAHANQQAAIGCVRSNSFYSGYTAASGIAVFTGTDYTEFKAPADWLCAEGAATLIRFDTGQIPFAQFIANLKAEASMMTSVFRAVGFVLLWIAAYCIFSPIAAAASMVDSIMDTFACIPCVGPVIDIIGDAIEGVGAMITCGLACACCIPSGVIVMSVMWVIMRPMYAVPLVLCLCLLPLLFKGLQMQAGNRTKPSKRKQRMERKKTGQSSQPPPTPAAASEEAPQGGGGGGAKFCTSCGAAVEGAGKFCVGCGAQVN